MVSYHSKLWRVVSSFGCPQFLLLPNVLDENWLIRAGSHYRRFSRNLFTLGTESVNTHSFLIRPLICEFSKISKSWKKKHQRRLCASVGQTNFSKSRKIKGARCQSCQQLKKVTPNIDDKVSKVKKSEISSFTLTFSLRAVRSYSMDGRDFLFPYYGHQMPRSEKYFFVQEPGQHRHPQFGLMWAPNKEESLLPCRDWTKFHRLNFPCVIDACIFSRWNATV